MRSLLGGSTHTFPPTTCVPDPLLSSFINNSPSADSAKDVEPVQLAEDSLSSNNDLDHDTAERYHSIIMQHTVLITFLIFLITVFLHVILKVIAICHI